MQQGGFLDGVNAFAFVLSSHCRRWDEPGCCTCIKRFVSAELVDGSPLTIYAKLKSVLADEAALHATWMCMGVGGTKMCIECVNMMSIDWAQRYGASETSGVLRAFAYVNRSSDLILSTKRSILDTYADLESSKAVLNIGQFKAKQTRVGFKFSPHCIIKEESLRKYIEPSQQNTNDFAHTTLLGAFPVEFHLFLEAMREHCISSKHLHAYLQRWVWPRKLEGRAASARNVLCEKRARSSAKAGTLKAQASEVLSLYPVLAHWTAQVPLITGLLNAECTAFLKLCEVIDLVWHCGRCDISPEVMGQTVEDHLELFGRAYGDLSKIPKHHLEMHYKKYLAMFGFIPTCLPHERKHRLVTAFGDAMDNTSDGSEKGLLRDVLAKQLAKLRHGTYLDMTPGLVDSREPPKQIKEFLQRHFGMAAAIRYSDVAKFTAWGTACTKDLVCLKPGGSWALARIIFHASINGVCLSSVSWYDRVEWHDRHSVWGDARRYALVPLVDIRELCIHEPTDDTTAVINPFVVRHS